MKLKQKPGDFRVTELLKDDVLQKEGKHHVYKVTKRKLTSMEAAEILAEMANVSAGDISMAGLKDRQGVTEQYMSMAGGKRVQLDTPELKLEAVGCMAEPLSAENSYGNGFEIRLRDLTPVERRRMLAHRHVVGRLGVPNYFDEQRFGNLRHGQGWIAKDLMLGRHEQALKSLLAAESEHDAGRIGAFKHALRNSWGDWSECREVAGRFGEHHSIFDFLGKNPTDFAGAFYHVSSRLRLIHLYAFQSHIWNRAVAAYFAKLSGEKGARLGFTLEGPQVFPDRKLDVDIDFAGSFRLPGEGLEDVENELQKQLLTAALKREGLSPEQFRISGVSGFQLKGEDRRLFIRPRHLKIEEVSASTVPEGSSRLTFELPRGAYATLVVRGLLSAFSNGRVELDRMADGQMRVNYNESRGGGRGGYGQRDMRDQRPGSQSDGPRRPQWSGEGGREERSGGYGGGGGRGGYQGGGQSRGYQGGGNRGYQGGDNRGQSGGYQGGGQNRGYQGGDNRGPSRGYQGGGQSRGYQGGGQNGGYQGGESRGYQGGQNRGYQGGENSGPSRGYQGGDNRGESRGGYQGGGNRGYQGGAPRGGQGGDNRGGYQGGEKRSYGGGDRGQGGGQSRGYQGGGQGGYQGGGGGQSRGYQGGGQGGYQGGGGGQSRGYQGGGQGGYQGGGGGQSRGYQGGGQGGYQGGGGGQSRGYQGGGNRDDRGGQSRGYQGAGGGGGGGAGGGGSAWGSKPGGDRPSYGNRSQDRSSGGGKPWGAREGQDREQRKSSWGEQAGEKKDHKQGAWTPRSDSNLGQKPAWGGQNSSGGGGQSPWGAGGGGSRGSYGGGGQGGGSRGSYGGGQGGGSRGSYGGQQSGGGSWGGSRDGGQGRDQRSGGAWGAKPGGDRGQSGGGERRPARHEGGDGDRGRKWEGANVPPPELGKGKDD